MKNIYSLVIVALMVAPVSNLRADNLDDTSSVITSRNAQRAGWVSVDGGLALMLHKFAQAPGVDRAAILKLHGELGEAKRALQKYGPAADEAMKKAVKIKQYRDAQVKGSGARWNGNDIRAEQKLGQLYDSQDEIQYRSKGKPKQYGGKGKLKPEVKPFNPKNVVTNAEMEADESFAGPWVRPEEVTEAEKAALDLLKKRDDAAKLIAELSDDVTKAETLAKDRIKGVDGVSKTLKYIRLAGYGLLALDVLGHGWAFYDNSHEPVFMGGLWKLGSEAHEAMFGEIEERYQPKPEVIPESPAHVKARNEALPRRGSLAPQGPVDTHGSSTKPEVVPATTRPQAEPSKSEVIEEPFNRLPPLQDEAPFEMPAKKPKAKPMM